MLFTTKMSPKMSHRSFVENIILDAKYSCSLEERICSRVLGKSIRRKLQVNNMQKNQGKYILSFETKDSNKIQFQVKYWIGGYVTPWGKIPWIPQRHIVDDFSMQITKTIINDSIVYDMTDKTIEEIISEIKSWSAIVQDYYDYYGLTWQVPEIGIRIKRNGKEEKIYYTNQNESVLRDSLYEAFY